MKLQPNGQLRFIPGTDGGSLQEQLESFDSRTLHCIVMKFNNNMIPESVPPSNSWDNLNETIFQNVTASVLNTLGDHPIIDFESKLKHHFLHREKR